MIRVTPKIPKIKNFFKRTAASLVSAAVALQTLTFFPLLLAPKVSAATSASDTAVATLRKVNVELTQQLTAVDKDTFRLELNLRATYAIRAVSERRDESKNGYYRVAEGAGGTYLLQLWGGDGADVDGAGVGGAGGYVYGTVELEEGDILYYRIGGDGAPVVNVYENEGGANGGAGHGEQGSSTVGGGGGYSAFFLFSAAGGDADRFATEYLNENGELKVTRISETDRVSKHLMIAGGGGGGGAEGSYASQTADGGAGGYVNNTNAGEEPIIITGGTVFPGGDGMTTGGILIDNLDSVRGKGGLDVPQDPPSTLLGIDDAKTANNWEGTNNPGIEGGAGGASEWRGGAGGAGYAGGTGGIMTSQYLPTNVSGGGGGSSYISNLVSYDSFDAAHADKVSELLAQDIHDAATAVGGEMRLVYLDVEEDLSYLDNITLSGELDKYFDVAITSTQGTVNFTPTTNYGTNSFSVSGINLNPGEKVEGDPVTVTLTLTRKSGFMGGNNVPVVCADYTVDTVAAYGDSCTLDAKTVASYVNVPLAFAQHANKEFTFTGTAILLSDFYTDAYASVRDNLSAHVEYDFIDSVGAYEVYDTAGNLITSDITSLNTTAVYQVRYVVSPKDNGYAAVGTTQWDTVYTHLVTVLVEGTEEVILHPGTDYESTFSYRKMLRYDADSGSYVLSMVLGSTARTTLAGDGSDGSMSSYVDFTTLTVADRGNDTTYTVPHSGYYLIQLWGAYGGAGGIYGDITRAAGGAGGYVYGYIYLQENEVLTVHLGAAGETPTTEYNTDNREVYGGSGGEYSYVTVGGDYLLIASGGGGGSGAGNIPVCLWMDTTRVDGTPGADATVAVFGKTDTQPDDDFQELNAYTGVKGEDISFDDSGSPAPAPAGANNYKNSAKMDRASEISSKVALLIDVNEDNCGSSADYTTGADVGTGEFRITPLQVTVEGTGEQAAGTAAKLGDYQFSAAFEQYFTVTDVSYEDFIGGASGNLSDSFTAQSFTLADFEPTVQTSVAKTADIEILAATSFRIDITLMPTEGFLGGNDVPILTADGIRYTQTVTPPDSTTVETTTGTMAARDDTDYANVAVVYDATALQEALTTSDKTIVKGDSVALGDLFDPVDADGNEVTVALPTGDWTDDYVEPYYAIVPNQTGTASYNDMDTFEAATVSPTVTTTYKIQIGVAPVYGGTKAVVVSAQSPITAENEATVYVLDSGVSVTYDLTDLSHDHTPDETGSYIADAESAVVTVTVSGEPDPGTTRIKVATINITIAK